MTANLLTLNSSKTEFLLIGLKQQLAKISSCSVDTAHSARNLGFIFDEHISFFDQISALSKSCNSHIRQLRCIRPYVDHKTASTIATSIVHSKLDYCNSLYYNLPNTHPASGISFPRDFAFLQIKKTYHSHVISRMSVRLLLHHHCHHLLLLLTFTPDSKVIFSINLFLHSPSTFSPTGLTPRTPAVFRFSRACWL